MPLYPTNWRPLILCSLLVAQKVWDDICISNSQFVRLFPVISLEHLNRLERKFLDLIEYDVTVSSSLYTKYYFNLISMSDSRQFHLKPLTVHEARLLEKRSASRLQRQTAPPSQPGRRGSRDLVMNSPLILSWFSVNGSAPSLPSQYSEKLSGSCLCILSCLLLYIRCSNTLLHKYLNMGPTLDGIPAYVINQNLSIRGCILNTAPLQLLSLRVHRAGH